MGEALELTVKQVLERMGRKNKVPLGVICYNMDKEELQIMLFAGVEPEEVNALLHKLKIKIQFTR